MTIASLIVDVAANTIKLQKDVEKINGTLDGVAKVAGSVAKAMAAAFTVTAIVGVSKQVLDYAGHVSDLSARLKVSTRTIQQWDAAFSPAGVSIDTVANASADLSAKIAGNDKSAVSALAKMGLSVEALRRMKPEERFTLVADAVGRVQDSAEQMYASKTLFGKGGVEMLSALDGHLGETIKQLDDMGLIMSEETIAAADAFGDQLGMMGKQLLAIVATVIGPLLPALSALGSLLMWIGANVIGPVLNVAVKGAIGLLAALWSRIAELLGKMAELGSKLPWVGEQFGELSTWLKDSASSASDYMAGLWSSTDHVAASAEAAAPKLLGLGRELTAQQEKTAALNATLKAHTSSLTASTFGTKQFTAALLHEDPAIRALDVQLAKLTTRIQPLETLLPGVTQYMYDWAAAHEEAAAKMGALMQQLTQMPKRVKTAAEAFRAEGGDGFLGGLKKSLTGGLSDMFGGADSIKGGVKNLLGGIGKGFQEGIGNLLSGGVASLVSSGIGLLTKGIGKVWGKLTNAEGRKVNDMRDAFQATFGGFDQMAAKAQKAGYQVERLLSTNKIKDFEREMQAMTRAIEFQDQAMATLEQTAEKYGLTIDELGPAWARQELDKKAQELFKDFQVLTSAGVDVDTVILRMGDSINAFVQQALATGTEIPAAMAPMLQRMVEMGLLTDKNGTVITDLETAGVKFAMTMSEGFQALISEVKQLTDAIARGLGTAIHNVPAVHVPVTMDELPTVPAMASGGIVRRPTLALIGEAGPEAVVPLSQYGRGSGAVYVEVVNVMDSRVVGRSVSRQQSRDLQSRRKLAAA